MTRINFDQNYYDVMRQIIKNSVDGHYQCQTSIEKDGKQYWVRSSFLIEELHHENENVFKPMESDAE